MQSHEEKLAEKIVHFSSPEPKQLLDKLNAKIQRILLAYENDAILL